MGDSVISLSKLLRTRILPTIKAEKQRKNVAFGAAATGPTRVRSRRKRARTVTALAILGLATGAVMVGSRAASASTTLIGSGSSAAGPEMLQWTADTGIAPYNLTV